MSETQITDRISEAELGERTERIAEASQFLNDIRKAVSLRVVGQERMVERLLIGLLTGGHVLLEGVPGLAKTLAVRTLADAIHTTFHVKDINEHLKVGDMV